MSHIFTVHSWHLISPPVHVALTCIVQPINLLRQIRTQLLYAMYKSHTEPDFARYIGTIEF